MGLEYTQQKLWESMYILVTAAPIRDRLLGVSVLLQQVRDDSAPEPVFPTAQAELQERFADLVDKLSDPQVIALRLSDEEASKLAQEVFAVFYESALVR